MTASELNEAGFRYERRITCCGGVKNEVYRNGDYELRIRPSRKQFIIKHKGNSVTSYLNIDQLKLKLNELEILEKKVN